MARLLRKHIAEQTDTRHVSSMIHSARPTVPPVAIIIFKRLLFCNVLKSMYGQKHVCENNDQPGLWVGRVDQYWTSCGIISFSDFYTIFPQALCKEVEWIKIVSFTLSLFCRALFPRFVLIRGIDFNNKRTVTKHSCS